MRKPIQVGTIFGDWIVINSVPVKTGAGRGIKTNYLCRCVCGVERIVNASNLRRGLSTGCGCRADRETSIRSKTHGMTRDPIYAVWRTMKQRCEKTNFRQYKDYGGRGIRVCDRWQVFESFLEDMGLPPTTFSSLERKDNDKGYEPGNVIWADRLTQARNKRNTVRFQHRGLSLTLGEWSQLLGIKKATLASRIYLYKWPLDRALAEISQKENVPC